MSSKNIQYLTPTTFNPNVLAVWSRSLAFDTVQPNLLLTTIGELAESAAIRKTNLEEKYIKRSKMIVILQESQYCVDGNIDGK